MKPPSDTNRPMHIAREPWPGPFWYWVVAYAVYVLSFVLGGFFGFLMGLSELLTIVTDPPNPRHWLMGIAWLANPALWIGSYYWLKGKNRKAAICGASGLLMATCTVGAGFHLVFYHLWVLSMQVFVFGSIRTARPQEDRVSPGALKQPKPISRKLQAVLYTAMALPTLLACLLFVLSHFQIIDLSDPMDKPPDPNQQVRVGEEARKQMLFHSFHRPEPGSDRDILPDAASGNFWAYEDGSWNRSIYYCVFECCSREQCLKAFELMSGHGQDQLRPWQPPQYAVTMEGPDFYSPKGTTTIRLKNHPWKLSQIRYGLYYERARDDQRFLEYYAIDLASNRIYFHQQIGGFPTKEYTPPPNSD